MNRQEAEEAVAISSDKEILTWINKGLKTLADHHWTISFENEDPFAYPKVVASKRELL